MKKKILILGFKHETNSFCPKKADMEAYRNNIFQVGEEVLLKQKGLRTEIGGFLDVFEKYDDFELIPSVCLNASPSGPVTSEMYNFVLKQIKDIIDKNKDFVGVLIDFHGAMVTEDCDDGEGVILEFIRNFVGWDIPIISTLDLHANVTSKMLKCSTALIPYQEYPHIDRYESGIKAATIMVETLLGKIKPVMAYRKIPHLFPLIPTASEKISPVYGFANQLSEQKDVINISFTHGFFASDIEELGMAVISVTNDNKELAETTANELYKFICDKLPDINVEYPSLEEALKLISDSKDGPVVFADASDNPGAGGLGDTTHILRAMLEKGITGAAFATITDEKAVEKCIQSGVGSTVELELGGWSDKEYSGGPLKVSAYVKKISDGMYMSKCQMAYGTQFMHGKTVVLDISGNTVIVTSIARQPYDIEIFYSHGINPLDYKTLVVKSTVQFRETFEKVASKIVTLALPGYAVPIPQIFKYKNWKGNK